MYISSGLLLQLFMYTFPMSSTFCIRCTPFYSLWTINSRSPTQLSATYIILHPLVSIESWYSVYYLSMSRSMLCLLDLLSNSMEVVQPFIMGCDSKNPKMVHISLSSMQRMIQHQAISAVSNAVYTTMKYMYIGAHFNGFHLKSQF